ncbi:dienelactone hydrolase [Aspergillus saccharolyticus JOP 1030-1]|uniref:Dienelactone hydrolase n=1 Tax=Aspergillus saccharolyticus JOP 1030-1 TaxID=1450539 RepID=A0A318ZP39_9EURO|nr:dienelactone hydrolase [Aspergillus saccharolyticus JOP 1030-1]PYH49359.1 dienelactone hydrolase [Aspergillus saccharolyticus JOP 1030-1]
MTCEACRTIPPVITQGYTPKGTYEDIAGLNTYVTGPQDASVGLIDIYDIFGFSSQTIQGADLLAIRLNAVVIIPDFFQGDKADPSWLPADTPDKQQALTKFVTTRASCPDAVNVLLNNGIPAYRRRFSSVQAWAVTGLCWGGKVAVLASGADTPFIASGQVHPGRMAAEDAQRLTIPHLVLASKDEPADVVEAYAKTIAEKGLGGHVETYTTSIHGWMGARADLESENSLAEYKRGYNQLADFFEKYFQQAR